MTSSRSAVRKDEPRAWQWNYLLFVALMLWTFLSMCFPMSDTDFWWHLKTGEWILSGNGIPYIDLYTFADADRSWIDLHWGFQVLITIVYRLGGVPLVTLVKAAVYTGAVGFAWHAGGTKLAPWKKTALWLLPIICISGRGNERPEMLTLLFLAIWLWLARRTDQRPRWICYLPLVQVIWVNCHALFVLGLIVGFSYAVDAHVRHRLGGRFGLEPRTAGPDLRTVWIIGGLVALGCFINPYFEAGALFPVTLYYKFSIEKDFYSRYVAEFQPPIDYVLRFGFSNLYLLAELGTWLATAASFVWLLAIKRRWSLFRLLLFTGFSHLAWQATRNTNIFALVSGFIACENLSDAVHSMQSSVVPRNQLLDSRRTKWMSGLVIGLSIAVLTGVWNQIGENNKPFALGERPHLFIHNAAKFAGQPGFPERAFIAHNGQADVYVFHNGPQHKVFMDARLEVCTQKTFERYINILRLMSMGSTTWESEFRDGELPVVILDSRTSRLSMNGMMNIPTWRLVFADRTAAVFLPVGLADKLQLPLVDPTPLMYPDGPPLTLPEIQSQSK